MYSKYLKKKLFGLLICRNSNDNTIKCTLYGRKLSQELDEYYDSLIAAFDAVRNQMTAIFIRDAGKQCRFEVASTCISSDLLHAHRLPRQKAIISLFIFILFILF